MMDQTGKKVVMKNILNDVYASFKTLNTEEFTVAKWRKGGEQKDKLGKTKENIDYILASKGWTVHKVLDMPTYKEIAVATGREYDANGEILREGTLLPCWKHPSDHMMIGVELAL